MRTPLSRLLSLVAAAEAAGGDIDAEDAARLLGIPVTALEDALEELNNFGVHPHEPGDHLDLELDDGRVVLHTALGLQQPLRLAPLDVALLRACLHTVRVGLDGDGRALCDRTEARLAAAGAGEPLPLPVAWAVEGGGAGGVLAGARRAVAERREASIDYWNASRAAVEARRVRPLGVVQHKGRWYVDAWCLRSDGLRHFRFDRILGLTLHDETFDPAAHAAPGPRRAVLFDRPAAPVSCVVAFPAGRVDGARRFFAGGQHDPEPIEGDRLRLSAAALPVLFRSLLSFGPPFEVLEPPAAREAFLGWLRASWG